jgi:hypothetical protein
MLLPIGTNCEIATILKTLGLRTCSYPFDWVISTAPTVIDLFLKILSSTDVDGFLRDFFQSEGNTTYLQEYDQRTVFKNTKYNLAFPHDDIPDLLEKYTRRFKRMKNNFWSAESVTMIYMHNAPTHTGSSHLRKFANLLANMRPNVRIVVVNLVGAEGPNLINLKVPYIHPDAIHTPLRIHYEKTDFFPRLKVELEKLLT